MKIGNILAYGALGLPLAFVALPLYVYIPHLYANKSGLTLTSLGGLLLLVRLFDAGIDPTLGWLADRYNRPRIIVLALLPLGLGFLALMHPPENHAGLWLTISLLVTYVGYSAATIAYQAMGADLVSDSRERTILTAAREALGLVGVLLAAGLPTLIATEINEGLTRLAWLFLPLLALSGWLTLRKQPIVLEHKTVIPVRQLPFWRNLKNALTEPTTARLLAIFIVNGVAAALPATLVLFFIADVLQASSYAGTFLALYFSAGALGIPLWLHIAARIGRIRSWLCAMALAATAFIWAFGLGSGDISSFSLVCFATGLALGADLTFPSAMAADLGKAQSRPGVLFGLWNFCTKLNLALAAGLALPLVSWFGYRPGEINQHGLLALSMVYALLPLFFKLLAAIMLWRWAPTLEKLQ